MKKITNCKQMIFWSFVVLTMLFSACNRGKSIVEPEEPKIPEATLRVNQFTDELSEAYLWIENVNLSNIDIKIESDPFALFEKYMYRTLDKWSFLSDDAESLIGQLVEGVETTYGMELMIFRFSNKPTSLFAVVKFVYRNSPAEAAGIKRGDLIMNINNQEITEQNYTDLFYSSSISVQFADLAPTGMVLNGKSISMTAKKMYEDPIQAYSIIDTGAHKIGYLCYTGYVINSHGDLKNVLNYFKTNNVTDVVLDLRYNPGGAVVTAQYLCSMLAPANAVKEKEVYLKELWNTKYTKYWMINGNRELNTYFMDTVSVNLDLKKLYILTSGGSASASEATIVGLESYLTVVKIGETTHGKYTGAMLLQPTVGNTDKIDPLIANWAMYLVVFKFANNDGFTDFTGGLTPQYEVAEDWKNYYEFGDKNDPLLAKAISLITGAPESRMLTRKIEDSRFKLFQDSYSERKGGMVKLGTMRDIKLD